MPVPDPVAADVCARLVLAKAQRIWADKSIKAEDRLSELGLATTNLVDLATAAIQFSASLLAESTIEAMQARTAARNAAAAARQAAQAAREQAVSNIITGDRARAKVAKAARTVKEAEEMVEAFSEPDASQRERVLSRGALDAAQRELAAAQAELAAAEKAAAPKGAP